MHKSSVAIAILFVILLVSIVGVCYVFLGSSEKSNATVASAPNYNGVYESAGDQKFVAKVQNGQITITWVPLSSPGLYWVGSFPTTTESVVSVADTKQRNQMAGSIFGSDQKTKQFDIFDGEIEFDFSILGTVNRVVLKKI